MDIYSDDKINNVTDDVETQVLLLNRLLFELRILRQSFDNIVDDDKHQIQIIRNSLKQLQHNFYKIMNNLDVG